MTQTDAASEPTKTKTTTTTSKREPAAVTRGRMADAQASEPLSPRSRRRREPG